MENKREESIKDATKKVWGASPAGTTYGEGHKKGSKIFFETVYSRRTSYECDWLDEVVNFKRWNGKRVLEIGCGAGYDAFTFCKNGALYTGIDITPDNPLITKAHLQNYGYTPNVYEMDAERLNLEGQFDYVYSFGVLHHTPNIEKVFSNIHLILKEAGEFQLIVYHKNSIFYWMKLFLFDWVIKLGFLKEPFNKRLARIEYTTSKELPLVKAYSKNQLRKMAQRNGFNVIRFDVRKLVWEDLPEIPVLQKLYSKIPRKLLNFFGKKLGWYISLRMQKAA